MNGYRSKWGRALRIGVAALLVGGLGLILFAQWRIQRIGSVLVSSELGAVAQRHVGLVLGCSPRLTSGQANPFFQNRIAAAARLYASHKVDYLLVSGDNRVATYDEPTAMKVALVQAGVPADHIVADYAGFSTYDSVERARLVFGLSTVCIISQRDHASRAVYIARARGMDAVGYAADEVPFSIGARTKFREALSRVWALGNVHIWHRKPHFLGPRIPVGPVASSRAADLRFSSR